MSKSRTPVWVSLILLGLGLLVVGIPGLWVYINATATKLHPSPGHIPSATSSPLLPKWAGAVERGREIVRASLSEENLPGLSVAVGIDGDIVWAQGFGFANLENGLPVTPRHRFRIGTASSLLTSAGIGLLADEGRLRLDDQIQAYVPEFPVKKWPVTIRQVMGHVGGVKMEDVDDGVLTSSHCAQTADAVKLFAKEPLLFQPGTEYAESTFGWVLLSAVVEAAAKKPFMAFLEDSVFRPLGMRGTVKDAGTETVADEATSYYPRFAPNPLLGLPKYGMHPLHRFDYSCYAGASGFLSTPSDLVRFGIAINGGKLLRRDTVQMLETSQRLASGKETGFGLGWEVKRVTLAGQQVRAAGRNGLLWAGTVASLLTFPERGMAVAVASNISFADTPSLAERIAQAFVEPVKIPVGR
ncbi:MAG: serine hydrolase domain-containing protein [Terriglobia bacterium]